MIEAEKSNQKIHANMVGKESDLRMLRANIDGRAEKETKNKQQLIVSTLIAFEHIHIITVRIQSNIPIIMYLQRQCLKKKYHDRYKSV